MKLLLSPLLLGLMLSSLLPASLSAQQPTPAAAPAAQPSPAELEAEFQRMLTNATLTGRWSVIKEGLLSPEREETYGIVSVVKGEGDKWTVNAKMKYNNVDFVIPIPARVNWAGDVPVLSVTDLSIPGGGTYWARVLFYKDTYAGSWGGGVRTGLINGMITQKPAP